VSELTSIATVLGGSFLTGLVTGILLRILTKWIILIAVLEIGFLTWLSNMGVISINWEALDILLTNMFTTIEGIVTGLGLSTSFIAGTVLGYLIKIGKVVEHRKTPRYLR